jgi:hypothetical protein
VFGFRTYGCLCKISQIVYRRVSHAKLYIHMGVNRNFRHFNTQFESWENFASVNGNGNLGPGKKISRISEWVYTSINCTKFRTGLYPAFLIGNFRSSLCECTTNETAVVRQYMFTVYTCLDIFVLFSLPV